MKKKNKIKKYIRKNLFNIITCATALIGLIISLVSLYENIYQNKKDIYPDIIVGSLENSLTINYLEKENAYLIDHNKNENINMKIANIGTGIAKNIELIWNEENSTNLRSLIKTIDKEKQAVFKEIYPILGWHTLYNGGGVNISKINYKMNIDYLLSEINSNSNKILYFPYEYMVCLRILCELSLYYNYDINEIINSTKLYLNVKYSDINNITYTKTIPINIKFDKTTIQDKTIFNIHINTEI